MVLQFQEDSSIAHAIKFAFTASNNEVVVLGLRLAKELSVTNLKL